MKFRLFRFQREVVTIALFIGGGLGTLWGEDCFALDLSVLGGLNFSQPIDGSGIYGRGLGYSGGLLIDYIPITLKVLRYNNSMHFIGFESGAFFQNKIFTSNLGGLSHTYTQPEIQIPLIIRFWISQLISLGIGGYYSFPLGSVQDKTSSGTSEIILNPQYDIGTVFSLRFTFRIGKTRLFFEGMYNSGFGGIQSFGSGLNDEIKVLFGIRFGLNPREEFRKWELGGSG